MPQRVAFFIPHIDVDPNDRVIDVIVQFNQIVIEGVLVVVRLQILLIQEIVRQVTVGRLLCLVIGN